MPERNTVLMLENDHTLLTLNKQALENSGFRVLAAQTIREARELAESGNMDLVLMEIKLPDGNGFDFCRELRKTKSIPLIFLTSLVGEGYIRAGYDAGADEYVTKPYRIGHLIEKVKSLIHG